MNHAKTFRFFISSTFSDFKKERQALHERVFPAIDKYLQDKHSDYTFQAIDLRWGVSEEAQYDQKTLDLCLNEVRSCKHYLHPNFLIMVGNRYGWVPLPYAIEKDEFERVLKHTKKEKSGLLQEWYKADENHLMNNDSWAYTLRQREPEGIYAKYEEWEKVENELRSILQETAQKFFDKKTEIYKKYFRSATEAEVVEGIFQYSDPTHTQKEMQIEQKNLAELDKEYVFGFIRDKVNINYEAKENKELKSFHESLTDALLDTNIIYAEEKENYLDHFSNKIVKKIKESIEKQVEEHRKIIPNINVQEIVEQKDFKNLKTKIFEGRESEIEKVKKYIDNKTSQPYIVHGISGIGKSAFMAKLTDVILDKIDETKREYTVYFRFIGATAASSNIRTLLESLIEQLSNKGVIEKPQKYKTEVNKFYEQINELLRSITKPVIIILDALDQLQSKDYLQWLPENFPENLKIIISVLDEGDRHYYDTLEQKFLRKYEEEYRKKYRLQLEKITDGNAECILNKLLKNVKRDLTFRQKKYVLKQISKSGNSPLYLKIALEEVKTWKSFDNEKLSVGIDDIIKEFIDNLTTKFHHDKDGKLIHKVLGLIKASKDGLSEKEILDLLSRDEEILKPLEKFDNSLTLCIDGRNVRRFPTSVWVRLYEQLQPFLMTKLVDGQNLIKFFHRQIDEVVGRYVYEPKKIELHKELEDYFKINMDINLLKNQKLENRNLRFLEEYPYHLSNISNKLELWSLLSNEVFIISKIVNNKFQSLLVDYQRSKFYNERTNKIYKMLRDTMEIHDIAAGFAYQFYLQQLHLIDKNYYEKNNTLSRYKNRLINHSQNFYTNGILENIFSGHDDVVKHLEIYDNILVSSDFKGNIIIRSLDMLESQKYKLYESDITHIKLYNNLLFVSSNESLTIFSLAGFVKKIINMESYITSLLVINNEIFVITHNDINILNLIDFELKTIFEKKSYDTLNAYEYKDILFIKYEVDKENNFLYKKYDTTIQKFITCEGKNELENIVFSNKNYSYVVESENTLTMYNNLDFKEIKKINLFDNYFVVTKDSPIFHIDENFILMQDDRSNNRLIFINLSDQRLCDEISHSKMIWDVKVSDNQIYTCSNDGLIKVWNIENLLKYEYDNTRDIENIYEESIILDESGSIELIPSITSGYCLVKSQKNPEVEWEYIVFNTENGNFHTIYEDSIMNIDENWNTSFREFSYEKKTFIIKELNDTPHKTTPIMYDVDNEIIESDSFLSDPIFIAWDKIYGVGIDVNNHYVIYRDDSTEYKFEDNGIEKNTISLRLDFKVLMIANQNGLLTIYDIDTQLLINAIFLGESIDSFVVCGNYLVFVSNGKIKCIEMKLEKI